VQASARDPLPKRTPPPDFDPTQSQLAFQYLSLTRLGGAQDLAEVFAGSYYIGMIEFADPWNLSCTRSPDGRYVAFYPSLEVEPYRGHLLWFDLLDLSVLHDPLPVLAPSWTNLAFSPDNCQLAFVSCRSYDPEEDCSIYVLDLASNAAEPLLAGNGSAISWSPDGRQLAFLGAFTRNRDYQVHVIDALTGEVAYTGPFDWENLVPADVDAPINSWGITFPNWETGLEACTTPPE
jgi:hypothetical protein